MKSKYYIVVFLIFLLTCSIAKAQRGDSQNLGNNRSMTVVNNYYNDFDYNFASRINRFHRSYAIFDYYSPFYTDPYLYNYLPFSLGIGIYGRGFGLGLSFNCPFYNYGIDGYYGYNPYFSGDYYMGYDPFYYSNWFSPFIFNLNFGSIWHNNYYSWYGHGYNNNYYHDRNYRYNERRPATYALNSQGII